MKNNRYILLVTLCIAFIFGIIIFASLSRDNSGAYNAKPVIYLYPQEEQETSVRLDYDENLTCTYPVYNEGWSVTARPDGQLVDENGISYNYLYWEGKSDWKYDFSEGFCSGSKRFYRCRVGRMRNFRINKEGCCFGKFSKTAPLTFQDYASSIALPMSCLMYLFSKSTHSVAA